MLHAGIADWKEADGRDAQQRRVEDLRAVRLGEAAELRVVAAAADVAVDFVTHATPSLDRPDAAVLLDGFDGAVERDPRHHLRVREMTAWTADFPDAFVGLIPTTLERLANRALERPARTFGRDALSPRLVERVEHLAVNVELQLRERGVPDPHRSRVLVSGQPVDRPLVEATIAFDAVHRLQLARISRNGAE